MNRIGLSVLRPMAAALPLLLVATEVGAQVDEADRYNRCMNNANRIAALTRQRDSIPYFSRAQVREAPAVLAKIDEAIDGYLAADPRDLDAAKGAMRQKVELAIAAIAVVCDPTEDHLTCVFRVQKEIEGKIKTSPAHFAEIDAIGEQYRYNYNRFIELKCDEFAVGGAKYELALALAAQQAAPATTVAPDPDAGLYASWMTGTFDTSYGPMDLTTGGGSYGGGDVTRGRLASSSIQGRVMEGTWSQDSSGGRCNYGPFKFTFSSSGFSGVWAYCNDEPTSGWSGSRRQQ